MPNPNDPGLMFEHKELSGAIERKKEEIEADPDNEALEDDLDALEAQMPALNRRMKDFRAAGRAERKRGGPPGQAKKTP